VIALDTNLLVHAHRADSPWHRPARDLVGGLAEGIPSWAIPWPCIHEFLAIVTHPRIWKPPTPPARAIDQVRAWLESPSVVLLAEGANHLDVLEGVLQGGRLKGARVHDARVAALCLASGVRELWTADRDFQRVPGLKTSNPLV